MVTEKLKKITETQKISVRTLAESVGMTERGYYAMIKNNSVKVDVLQKISNVLHIPITYFFTDSTDLPTVEVGKVQETKELAYPAELVKYKKALHRERKRNDRLLTIIEKQADTLKH